jgi:hypothetical protein
MFALHGLIQDSGYYRVLGFFQTDYLNKPLPTVSTAFTLTCGPFLLSYARRIT